MPPNVIIILTDDMREDDLNGGAMQKTLAALGPTSLKGSRYSRAICPTALCSPSRASLLSGQYAHNTGVWSNEPPDGGVDLFDDANTLPVWLQSQGYATAFVGKYMNRYGGSGEGGDHPALNPTYVPPGWSRWAGWGYQTYNYNNFDVTTGSSTPTAPGIGTVKQMRDTYSSANVTSRAKNMLSDLLPGSAPVFALISYVACHDPAVPSSLYKGTSTVGLPTSTAFDEDVIQDKPPWVADNERLTDTDKDTILKLRRKRRETLMTVDDGVQDIVDLLRDNGELGNTWIFFLGDNGFMLGEHRIKSGKKYAYEESTKVPLLVRGPDVTPGTYSRMVAANIDVTATIVDVTGIQSGHELDGQSLRTSLPTNGFKRPVLIESAGNADAENPNGMPAFTGVRVGKWTFVAYADGREELYDNTADPDQLNNLAGQVAYGVVQLSLSALTISIAQCSGPLCSVLWTDPTA